jgi:hypothetical protein
MSYNCNKCNKDYASYQSLWKHNKIYHSTKNTGLTLPYTGNNSSTNKPNKKTYTCELCNKIFTRKNNMNYHKINVCPNKNIPITKSDIIELKDEITKLKTELQNKPQKKFINNGTIVNGTNNNKLVINKIGTENILELNDMEITDIFNKEIEGVIKLIEFVNFNERLPSNHNFCTTALDSPYLSTFNTNTNTIDKDRKKYFFDELFIKAIERQEILYKNNKTKFNPDKRKKIEENILNMKKIRDYNFNHKIVREIMKKLNLLSYNKRNIIQRTWRNDPDEDTDDEYFAKLNHEESEEDESEDNMKMIEYVEVYDNDVPYLKPVSSESDYIPEQLKNLGKKSIKKVSKKVSKKASKKASKKTENIKEIEI